MTTALLLLFALSLVQCVLYVTSAPTTPVPGLSARFFCINPSYTTYKETHVDDKDIAAKLDLKLKFAFYVHGWKSEFEYDDKDSVTYKIGLEWVKSEKTNFCGVDWRELADDWYINASQKHVKTIGRQLAAFIKLLHDLGVELDTISIAGHSLGSHIAGYSGQTIYERFNERINSIYALDPAGPAFTSVLLFLRSDYILSKNDASYVQVLHTSIGTYGTSQFLGHADYYVNNGKVQTTCLFELFTFTAFACSHGFAKDIFLSSFSHSCAGKIEEIDETPARHDVYGIHTHKRKGVFKIKTTASEPYCM